MISPCIQASAGQLALFYLGFVCLFVPLGGANDQPILAYQQHDLLGGFMPGGANTLGACLIAVQSIVTWEVLSR